MKTKFNLIMAVLMLIAFKQSAQVCQANFLYSLGANGNITFSNLSYISSTYTPIFVWDLGNGSTFTTTAVNQTVSTTYSSNGIYTVTLKLDQNMTSCYSSQTKTISFSKPFCSLNARVNVITPTATVNPVVHYSNTSTGTQSNTTYTWDFDDGTTSNLAQPGPHTYSMNGIFGLTLTAVNNATCSSFLKIPYINWSIPNSWPWMTVCSNSPTITYTAGLNGLRSFNLSGVKVQNNSYLSWYFGDFTGSFGVTTPTHTFFNGTYTVNVIGNLSPGGSNCSFNRNSVVTVTDNVCDANSAFTNTVGQGGAVQFNKTNPPTNPNIQYLWNFGDGVLSTQMNPSHTYPSAGIYTVDLLSYDNAYPIPLNNYTINTSDTTFMSANRPCRSKTSIALNITGISCIANSNFSVTSPYSQYYYAYPDFPYNISQAVWNWGDGTSSNQLYTSHTYSAAGNYDICLTVTASCGATAATCYNQALAKGTKENGMVYINIARPAFSTNFEEHSGEDLNMSIFPNPSNGLIHLDMSKIVNILSVEIYNLTGIKVFEIEPKESFKELQIDLGHLEDGIYFVKLKTKQQTVNQKIILRK